ncbi:MAG: nucleoside phosphorylase [Thermoprotei archaeon]|nr:MAG: nucleoside phosphorylase [Thermoprotei archaeon]
MNPVHILAKPGDIAERAIVAGDPARVKYISEMLENPRLVNDNRGFLTYTGSYEGVEVTIATHGVGAPSSAIVFEELIMLGAKVIVRLGTTGGIIEDLHIGDVVIPSGAAYMLGGTIGAYAGELVFIPAVPDFTTLSLLVEEARRSGLKFIVAPIVSSDAFYEESSEFVKKWSERGIVSVEMECATLFILGLMRKVKTGALLIVSNSLIHETEKRLRTAEELEESVHRAAEVVLKAITKIQLDE